VRRACVPVLVLAALLAAGRGLAQQHDAISEPATGRAEPQAVHAARFMIVAAHPLAARAGYEVLKSGGNAVDAAIAALLALNVVEPQSSGIGGGFALVYSAAERKLTAWDGRETAPAAANAGRAARHRRDAARPHRRRRSAARGRRAGRIAPYHGDADIIVEGFGFP